MGIFGGKLWVMDEDLLTSPEVCRLAGCSYRQLDYWTHEGVVAPTRPSSGSGTVRGWTVEEAAIVRLLATMAKLGCQLPVLRNVITALRSFPELWSGKVLITADGAIRPSGIASGLEGWHVDLAGCRAYVGAPAVPWPATA